MSHVWTPTPDPLPEHPTYEDYVRCQICTDCGTTPIDEDTYYFGEGMNYCRQCYMQSGRNPFRAEIDYDLLMEKVGRKIAREIFKECRYR